MSKFIVTDEQRRRIAEKTGTISRTKNENAWQFVVTDEARRRLEQNREKKLLEEERRRALAPYAGAWVDRQLQRTVGLIDNEKIDPAAKTQTETRTPLYEMSFPRVSSPQLERKTSERIATRNAAALQDTPLLPSERAVSNLQTRPYTPETKRREISVLAQRGNPAAAVAQNAGNRAERVKTWDTQEYGKLNTEYEQRQTDYEQRKQSYIRRQFDSADFSMGDTAAAQVFYKQAAEEYDRQNAAAREETNQLGEYLKSRKESEDLKADLRQIQLYTDEWKNVDNNRGVPENAAVYEAMNGRWTQAKVDNILKGTSSEAYVSDTERNVVAYLLATGRDQDAIQFAQTLDKRILNSRQEIDIHKKAQAEAQRIAAIDNGFARSLASAWQAIQGGFDGAYSKLQNFGRGILGSDDLRTGVNELANAYNIERVEGETWVGATLLKALTAGIEMTPAIGAGMLTGGMGTVAGMSVSNLAAGGTLFAQAAGGSYAEAIRDGYSVGEARMYGVLTGSMEVLTNKFLGGVKGLTSESTAVKSIRKTVESASKKLIKNPTGQKLLNILGTYAGEGASEGIEELIQAIAEPVVRDFVFNEQNGIQLSAESFEEALIGALTAWMINAPATGVQSIRTLASRNSSAVNELQSLNDAPADGSIAAEVANAPDSSVDVKARDALRTLYQGRQISNSQAEAILDSPEALNDLQSHTGTLFDGSATKSQRRAAVKQAMNGFYQRAQAGQSGLISTLNQIAQETGAQVVDPGAKSVESLVNKVARKNVKQTDYTVFSAKDHARAALLVNDFNAVPQTIEALKKHFPNLSGEVFIDTPLNKSGYRGIHLSVAMDGGVNAEIQLSTPQAWKIKKQTDAIYDKWRNANWKTMTAEQRAAYQQDYAASSKLWEDYYAGLTPEVKRMASSSVMGLESSQTPNVSSYSTQAEPKNSNNGNGVSAASNLPSSVNEYSTRTPPAESDGIIPQNAENSNIDTAQDEHVGSFGENTVGSAQAPVRKPHDELLHDYGALPRGEQLRDSQGNRITRDVEIAARRYEDTRTSRFARTVAEAGATPDEAVAGIKAMIERGGLQYESVSNAKNIEQAKQFVKEQQNSLDLAAIESSVLESLYGEKTSVQDVARGELLLRLAMERRDAPTILEFTAALAAAGTRAGQTVQAFNLLKRMGPTGAIIAVQKQAQKLNAKKQAIQKKSGNQKELARARQALDYATQNDVLTDEAVRTVQQETEREVKRLQTELDKLDVEIRAAQPKNSEPDLAVYRKEARNAKALEKFQQETGMTVEEAQARIEELKPDLAVYREIRRYQRSLKRLQEDANLSPEERSRGLSAVKRKYSEEVQRFKAQNKWDKLKERTIQSLETKIKRLSGEVSLSESIIQDIASQKTQAELDEAVARAYLYIAEQLPSDWSMKLQAWRYMCMLINPKTHIRNFVGNGAMVPCRTAARVFKMLFEEIDALNPFSKRTRADKTQKLYNPFSEQDRAILKYAQLDYNEASRLSPESNRYTLNNMIQENMRIFKNQTLEQARKLNFKAMEWEDQVAKKSAYAHEFTRQMKAKNLTLDTATSEQLAQIRKISMDYALKATYQNVNRAARALSRLSNIHYGDNTTSKVLKTVGGSFMPFVKTPVNIAYTAFQYSPLGVTNTIHKFIQVARKTGDANAAIQSLSENMTGIALSVAGYLLASMGFLIGGGGDDDRAYGYKQDMGLQNYALRIGDSTYTLDWLAPAVIPLFMGVEAYYITQDEDKSDWFLDALDIAANLVAPMMEMSMLSSVDSLIDVFRYSKKGEWPVNLTQAAIDNLLSQSIPTFSGVLARSIDPSRRITSGSKTASSPTLDGIWRKWAAKIPGLTYVLEPYIDVWGDTQDSETWERLLENLVSPGYFSDGEWTPANKEIYALYLRTGNSTVLPESRPASWWERNNERVQLNAKQYTEYKQNLGRYSELYINDITSDPLWSKLTDEQKIDTITGAYSSAKKICKDLFAGGKSTYTADMAKDEIYKVVVSDAKGRKNDAGKTIPGSVKQEKIQRLMDIGVPRNEAVQWLNREN